MKKILKLIIMTITLSMIVACGKAEDNNPTTASTAPSTTASIGETTTIEEETTPQRCIIPNTAGIVVIKEEKQTEESDTEAVNEIKHLYSAEEDAKRLGVSKIVVFQSDYSMVYNVGTDILREFNTLLVEKYNCDFVVSFAGIDMFNNYY